jgi:mRNA interferase MazF
MTRVGASQSTAGSDIAGRTDVVLQGELYWFDPGEPSGSEPGFRHPWIVIQNNAVNASRLRTTVVVGVTSNLRRAAEYGNVRVRRGEAGLPEDSVAVVSQIFTVDRRFLGVPAGTVSAATLAAILRGVSRLLDPLDP